MLQGTLQNELEDVKCLLNASYIMLSSFHKYYWLFLRVVKTKGIDIALLKHHPDCEWALAVLKENLCLEQKWSRLKEAQDVLQG